jgi:hypothetical protein
MHHVAYATLRVGHEAGIVRVTLDNPPVNVWTSPSCPTSGTC